MTNAYLDLARRCEELEPDWGEIVRLNEDIHAITPDPKTVIPPDYCRSLDAAMSLVPENADSFGTRLNVEAWNDQTAHPPHVRATAWVAGAARCYAATPALALCAAGLRARGSDNG